MAREANPLNAAGREAQVRYRRKLERKRQPEVPVIDTAIAVAVAVYGHGASLIQSDADIARFEAIEKMSANYLAARGFDRDEAVRRVHSRLNRLDVADLAPLVKNAPRPSTDQSALPITPK